MNITIQEEKDLDAQIAAKESELKEVEAGLTPDPKEIRLRHRILRADAVVHKTKAEIDFAMIDNNDSLVTQLLNRLTEEKKELRRAKCRLYDYHYLHTREGIEKAERRKLKFIEKRKARNEEE